ncbi:HesA/MoeB/ThiF family protein [Halodurantibacterium flavum]|uniref:HesA/MoeB/ThiF family protein n=1 Tax=Halodurantibacterium flavum TaxID=1382802 RepID=A0ABW4S9Z6_9RHOB
MALVLILCAAIWGIGWAMGAPVRARLGMMGLLLIGVILGHLILPPDNPLRTATGGNAAGWVVLIALIGLGMGYRAALARLRSRARTTDDAQGPAQPPKAPFSDAELDRYARHIMLREVGGPGQKALKSARVLVIGAGGLGSPALLYLAAAGVGTIGVIDDDAVENSNLQRQVIHTDDRIGMPKVFSAEKAMRALNPHVTIRPYHRRLTPEIAAALFSEYDLILDGSDNFDTRYLVNRVAVRTGKPLIAAAMARWEGQIALYDSAAGTACFECVFPERPAPGLVPTCAEAGVIAPLPGVLGSMMALEAVKHLTGAGQTLAGRLLIHDALYAETRAITLHRRPDCAACGSARTDEHRGGVEAAPANT